MPFGRRVREFMAEAAGLPTGCYLAICHGGTAGGMLNDVVRRGEQKLRDDIRCPVVSLENTGWAEFLLTADRQGDALVRWNMPPELFQI